MSATNEAGGRRHIVRLLFCAIVFSTVALFVHAQSMPQDSWVFSYKWGSEGTEDGEFGSLAGIVIGPDGMLYVAECGDNPRIQVFHQDGTFIRKWGSPGTGDGQFGSRGYLDLAFGTDNLLYVLDRRNHRIQVFQQDGTFVRKWGEYGTGDGQFTDSIGPSGLAIDSNGFIYVADTYNFRIQVFKSDGTFIRKWGSQGSLDGQFGNWRHGPHAIEVGLDGMIYVSDEGNERIQVFKPDGTFVRKMQIHSNISARLVVGSDGVIYFWNDGSPAQVNVIEQDGTSLRNWSQTYLAGPNIAVSHDGVLYSAGNNYYPHAVSVFNRAYRIAPSSGAIPLPRVISTTQRAGEPHLEVDYTVLDSDSPKVAVAIAAFSGGTNSLNNLIKMETFLEGSEAFLGTNIDANVTNQVVWDVGADVPDDYVNLKVRVMAQDERGLMAIDFITLPEDGEDPALTISRSPIKQSDMLPLWFWLVASGDASVMLTGAEVHGVGGEFDGQTLAQGTDTTSNGRNYLWNRLDVREATSDEVTRARTGPSGVVNQWTPRITVGPGDRPEAVNEWGFDTGANGWWVVKE